MRRRGLRRGKTAQVAYPMCLEHIAAPNIALTQYRDAEAKFGQRLVDLDVLTSRTQDLAWDTRLLDALARPDVASTSDPTLSEWRARIGHDDWLNWFNADSTQVQLQQLRDLERISASLADTRAGRVRSARPRHSDERFAPGRRPPRAAVALHRRHDADTRSKWRNSNSA